MRFEYKKEESVMILYKSLHSDTAFKIAKEKLYHRCVQNKFNPHNALECANLFIKAYKNALTPFSPELISSRFEASAKQNIDSIKKHFMDNALFEIFGNRSGIMIFSDRVNVYDISANSVLLISMSRKCSKDFNFVFFQNIDFKENLKHIHENNWLTLITLFFKDTADIKTQIISPNARRSSIDTTHEILYNRAPFAISQTDCTWYTSYYSDSKIPVRGFWRHQRYGKGRKDSRLIFIQPFEKRGYHRKAKMLCSA